MPEFFNAETKAEHRKFPRKHLKLRIYFKCLQKGDVSRALDSLAEDLGAGGMAMSVAQKMTENQLLMVTLLLPKAEYRENVMNQPTFSEKECESVAILSRLVWCAPKKDNEYIVGVEFLDLNSNHRNVLKKFLVDFDLDKPDSNLYVS